MNMTQKNKTTTKKKREKGLEVIGNPLTNKFISSSPPTHLRSKYYSIQAVLGILGIFLLFLSFKVPVSFFAGAILLFIRHQWRMKTDEHAISHRKAITALKRKKYAECIQMLDKITSKDSDTSYFSLVKASCYLELEDTEAAYQLYLNYFEKIPSSCWSDPIYWSAQENAVILALEHNHQDLVKKIIYNKEDTKTNAKEKIKWKAKYTQFLHKPEL